MSVFRKVKLVWQLALTARRRALELLEAFKPSVRCNLEHKLTSLSVEGMRTSLLPYRSRCARPAQVSTSTSSARSRGRTVQLWEARSSRDGQLLETRAAAIPSEAHIAHPPLFERLPRSQILFRCHRAAQSGPGTCRSPRRVKDGISAMPLSSAPISSCAGVEESDDGASRASRRCFICR